MWEIFTALLMALMLPFVMTIAVCAVQIRRDIAILTMDKLTNGRTTRELGEMMTVEVKMDDGK